MNFRTSIIFVIFLCKINAQYVVDVLRVTSFGEEELIHKCAATGGNFGKDLADFIITDENLGCGVPVEPDDACKPIKIAQNHTSTCPNMFAFVSRSDATHPCKFSHQAFMVQNSSYSFRLVIFYNYPGLDPISMEGAEFRGKIFIPVIMISNSCKNDILKNFPSTASYRLRVRIDPGYYELFRYLIPFLVVIVFCFALFLITLCVRGCIERRKLNKRRLSKRNLRKIPVKKYRLGDDPDTCAICLENFVPGEKLRHLPCKHVFHCECIDVWLTQTRKVCPLCKRKIGTDSDSECSNELYGDESQRNVEIEDYQGIRNFSATPATQLIDVWSSREALVDQDILLLGTARRTISSYVRNIFRQFSNNTNWIEEGDSNVETDTISFLASQQTRVDESDHLLNSQTSSITPDASDSTLAGSETLNINSDPMNSSTCIV